MPVNQQHYSPTCLTRIPDDVICELYAVLAAVDPPRRDQRSRGYGSPAYLGWIQMTHVCRRLRALGISLARLWADIVCVFPKACEIILERARNAPLTLELRVFRGGVDYFKLLPVFDILPRTRHITDRTPDIPDLHRKLWWKTASLANLEYLCINLGWLGPLTGDPGHIVAPMLRTYITSGVFVPFTAPSLRSLRVDDIALIQLLEILRGCQLLQSLCVRTVGLPASAKAHLVEQSTVSLPHLQELRITYPNVRATLKFFEHVTFPPSLSFTVLLHYLEEPDLLHGLVALPQFNHDARDTLSITASSETEYGHGRFILQLSEGRGRPLSEHGTPPARGLRFDCKLDMDDELQISNALSHISPDNTGSIRVLALYGGQHFHSKESYADNWYDFSNISDEAFASLKCAIRSFANVHTIYISDLTNGYISMLSSTRDDITATGVFPDINGSCGDRHIVFPHLRTIVIDSRCQRMHMRDWDYLIATIRSRCDDGCPIQRLVLMGSGLCHAVIENSSEEALVVEDEKTQASLLLHELSWEDLQSYGVEVTDLRGGECRCLERGDERVLRHPQPDRASDSASGLDSGSDSGSESESGSNLESDSD